MIRARLAAGILKPEQMYVAAEVAETCGNRTLHQNFLPPFHRHKSIYMDNIYYFL
jgi:hypothetical protein